MAAHLTSYLHRNRYGVYGFRVHVPLDLQAAFKSRECHIDQRLGVQAIGRHGRLPKQRRLDGMHFAADGDPIASNLGIWC